MKIYKEPWSKITTLIRSVTKNSDNNDEKHMKIKFNLDDKLTINKTIKIPSMIIVVRAAFPEDDKYYSQVLLV